MLHGLILGTLPTSNDLTGWRSSASSLQPLLQIPVGVHTLEPLLVSDSADAPSALPYLPYHISLTISDFHIVVTFGSIVNGIFCHYLFKCITGITLQYLMGIARKNALSFKQQ